MSTHEITAMVESLRELENLNDEAKAEAETLRDTIKQEMLNRDTEELTAGQYIVRYTPVLSNRFDTTAFKKVMPEVYKAYSKQISSRRFTISVWIKNTFQFEITYLLICTPTPHTLWTKKAVWISFLLSL